jgi:hypothetical protein
MKPGRVKEEFGCDRFTLLFEFSTISSVGELKFVVSFNGATSSHSRPRVFALRVDSRFLVISISFRNYLVPLELDPGHHSGRLDRFPLVLTSRLLSLT